MWIFNFMFFIYIDDINLNNCEYNEKYYLK